ncbi:MAG: amidase family protein, partial [Pseudomonadota bacterium]
MPALIQSLDLVALRKLLREGHIRPAEVIDEVYRRISHRCQDNIWITLIPREDVLEQARAVEEAWRRSGRDPEQFPLYGIPFALKDNIDLAGVPTTAGCPDFRYVPETSASCVTRLLDAGALCVGK